MYGDDAVFYISGKDPVTINRKLQEDLDKIGNWMKFNKLTVNVAKSKYLLVGSKSMLGKVRHHNIVLSLDNNEFDRVLRYEYLGVFIDQTLSFEHTANTTYARAILTRRY